MKRWALYKARGLVFITWHGRHYLYHILLGLMWAWFLQELWNEFNLRWIALSLIGSILPDFDHLLYHTSYGKNDAYTKQVMAYLKNKEWRNLTLLFKNGHKHNTNLSYHNYYFLTFLLLLAGMSTFVDWEAGIILFGAMVIHFVFDIFDDLFVLGYVNPNWKRWGKEKSIPQGPRHFF